MDWEKWRVSIADCVALHFNDWELMKARTDADVTIVLIHCNKCNANYDLDAVTDAYRKGGFEFED